MLIQQARGEWRPDLQLDVRVETSTVASDDPPEPKHERLIVQGPLSRELWFLVGPHLSYFSHVGTGSYNINHFISDFTDNALNTLPYPEFSLDDFCFFQKF